MANEATESALNEDVAYIAQMIADVDAVGFEISPTAYRAADLDGLSQEPYLAESVAEADEWTLYARIEKQQIIEIWDFDTPQEAAATLALALQLLEQVKRS